MQYFNNWHEFLHYARGEWGSKNRHASTHLDELKVCWDDNTRKLMHKYTGYGVKCHLLFGNTQ